MQSTVLKNLGLLGAVVLLLATVVPVSHAAGKDDEQTVSKDCLAAVKSWNDADKKGDEEYKQAMKTCERADKEKEDNQEKKSKLVKSCKDEIGQWENADKKEDSAINEIVNKCKFDK